MSVTGKTVKITFRENQKGNQKSDNSETLATLYTHDTVRRQRKHKNIIQRRKLRK